MPPHDLPDLEERLSRPTPAVIDLMRQIAGDFIVLGAAGKMGPSLARMIKRASDDAGTSRRVIAVSRFSSPGSQEEFKAHGIETVARDLLDANAVSYLAAAANVIYMAGMKFGATGNESLTWAMNAWLPGLVCERYSRSRIVAFSTGNVYGLTPVENGGSREEDALNPAGEYAMSCLGRERLFEHFSRVRGTPVSLIRLNYACDLRYGVLVDIARKVWAEEPVDVTMGHFNTIWQGDANARAIQCLAHTASPPIALNVTGLERVSIRWLAQRFGELLQREPVIAGTEGEMAWLWDAARSYALMGPPSVSLDEMVQATASWIQRGGETLNKPTHFESTDGRF
jgi:nucleoside-diphosphate-sugar epimerase